MSYTFPVSFKTPVQVEIENAQKLSTIPTKIVYAQSNRVNGVIGNPFSSASHQDRNNKLNVFVPANEIWYILGMVVSAAPSTGASTYYAPTMAVGRSNALLFFTQGCYGRTDHASPYVITLGPNVVDAEDWTAQPQFRHSRRAFYSGPLMPDDVIFFDEWDGYQTDNLQANILIQSYPF